MEVLEDFQPQENKQLRDALDEAKIMRKALEQAVANGFDDGWKLPNMRQICCKFSRNR